MYLHFFGLTEPPFSITPDPAFVYLSPAHRDALAHLLYGVGQGGAGGFVQLTGEVGTGKTTICRCLLEQVPADAQIALILNPMLSPLELLATICEELGIPTGSIAASGKTLVDSLNAYLLEQHAAGRRVVLVIDEAQNLGPEALEQVRLLTNLETAKHKLLQIVLLGQPELRRLLERQDLRQLAQRITARYHLAPLSESETFAYVKHRMNVAGARQNPFTRGALKALYQRSRGIPRLINIIADRALAGAYARERTQVDRNLVHLAANEVQPGEERVTSGMLRWWPAAVAILLLAVAGIILWPFGAGRGPAVPSAVEVVTASPQGGSLDQEGQTGQGMESSDGESKPATGALQLPQSAAGEATSPASSAVDAIDSALVPSPDWLQLQDLQTWDAVAELWRDAGNGAAVNAACEGQVGSGYGCVREQGSWARIMELGLPAILVLEHMGRYHVLLRSIEEQRVRLGTEFNGLSFSRSAIEPLWSGEYYVAWPQAPDWPVEIRAGESGEAVEIVMRMAALADPPWTGGDEFDANFEAWLMGFQRQHGLKADGIIGPRTLLYLMAPAVAEPRLSAQLVEEP